MGVPRMHYASAQSSVVVGMGVYGVFHCQLQVDMTSLANLARGCGMRSDITDNSRSSAAGLSQKCGGTYNSLMG